MIVAKLSDGRIVQLLKPAQAVAFSRTRHVLVCNKLTTRMRSIDPYWVKDVSVVWSIEFRDKYHGQPRVMGPSGP